MESKPDLMDLLLDLLSEASEEQLKCLCELAQVPCTGWKQHDIVTILSSAHSRHEDILQVVKDVCAVRGRNSDIEPRTCNAQGPLPVSGIPRHQDPYYREMTNEPSLKDANQETELQSRAAVANDLRAGDIELKHQYAWLGPSDGWATMQWHSNDPIANYDWVGLYNHQNADMNDYITYQWATNGLEYQSNQYYVSGLSVRYYRWYVNGYYNELFRSGDLDLAGEVNANGETDLYPEAAGCWIGSSGKGYAVLNWLNKSPQNYDWIGLYASVTSEDSDYISSSWQWAKDTLSYETTTGLNPGMQARYLRWDYGKNRYVCLRRSKPIAKGYWDLENLYTNNSLSLTHQLIKVGTNIFNILIDQLSRLMRGEPSVLSPGFAPFPENLIWKNLSYQECLVIGNNLRLDQWYSVLMVYYNTYRLAIEIRDDSERNAKRHAFWQISMYQQFGEDFAKKIGRAHEEGRPGTELDNEVDDYNNAAAIQYAKEHPGVDPKEAANIMWNSKMLKGYINELEFAKDEL